MEGMKTYIGARAVRAKAMTRGEVDRLLGLDGIGKDNAGYVVEFEEGADGIWMAAELFERSYRSIDDDKMDFSDALLLLKGGRKVARESWNSDFLWLTLVKQDKEVDEFPHFIIETASGGKMGWLVSHVDMLADDWRVVRP
jgi:hypothetical protein